MRSIILKLLFQQLYKKIFFRLKYYISTPNQHYCYKEILEW